MRITGISFQHRNMLFDKFPEESQYDCEGIVAPSVGRLLRQLQKMDGPDLWICSSHQILHFHANDAQKYGEHTPSLAWAFVNGCYHIEYCIPREFRQIENAVARMWETDVSSAARSLIRAIECSDANPDRHSAKWHWFVCPECDLHAPQYLERCARCHYQFPEEANCKAVGYWRKPILPERAASLQYPPSNQQ